MVKVRLAITVLGNQLTVCPRLVGVRRNRVAVAVCLHQEIVADGIPNVVGSWHCLLPSSRLVARIAFGGLVSPLPVYARAGSNSYREFLSDFLNGIFPF